MYAGPWVFVRHSPRVRPDVKQINPTTQRAPATPTVVRRRLPFIPHRTIDTPGENLQSPIGIGPHGKPVDPAAQRIPSTPRPPGAVCQLFHTAPSAPRAKISKRPSAFDPTSSRSTQPPNELQPLQPLFGAVCHLFHTAPSTPRAKTSNAHRHWTPLRADRSSHPTNSSHSRPIRSGLPVIPHRTVDTTGENLQPPIRVRADISRSTQPPNELQPLQPLFGAVCQLFQTAPSTPRAKTSNRPSALDPTVRRSTQPPKNPSHSKPHPVRSASYSTPHRRHHGRKPPTAHPRSTDASRSTQPPNELQPLQPLFGAVCQLCQRALSAPRAITSIRPGGAFGLSHGRFAVEESADGAPSVSHDGGTRAVQDRPDLVVGERRSH